jgi:hypothetical protein
MARPARFAGAAELRLRGAAPRTCDPQLRKLDEASDEPDGK